MHGFKLTPEQIDKLPDDFTHFLRMYLAKVGGEK